MSLMTHQVSKTDLAPMANSIGVGGGGANKTNSIALSRGGLMKQASKSIHQLSLSNTPFRKVCHVGYIASFS